MPEFFEPEKMLKQVQHDNEDEPLVPKMGDAGEIRTLLTWHASSRPFRKKDSSYYRTIAILVSLLVIIALFAHEFLLILVILALMFVSYVLAFVPPSDVDYKIST